MPRIPWNLCTTFAAIGALLAFSILLPIFGFFWVFLPGAAAGILAAYAISTALGSWALTVRLGNFLIRSIVAGIGIALTTSLCAAFALGLVNFLIETGRELLSAPSGQPFWNAVAEYAPHNAERLIVPPVVAAALYGFIPATVLGAIYGMVLGNLSGPPNAPGAADEQWRVGPTAGAILAVGLLVVLGLLTLAGARGTRTADAPLAITGCGSTRMASGVLAYCWGHPCEAGQCDWETTHDAFAFYVEPPPDGGWDWTGGGLGTGSHPGMIRHNIYWVKKGPGGLFDESNPRYYTKTQMRFRDSKIEIGGRRFEFEPGMLIVIQFADDWSFSADVGRDALASTTSSLGDLQQTLDETCQELDGCDAPFKIRVPLAELPGAP